MFASVSLTAAMSVAASKSSNVFIASTSSRLDGVKPSGSSLTSFGILPKHLSVTGLANLGIRVRQSLFGPFFFFFPSFSPSGNSPVEFALALCLLCLLWGLIGGRGDLVGGPGLWHFWFD